MLLSWATNKAAFQHYQAIKNRNGDIYLMKDKEDKGTTEEAEQTTETTTENDGEKGAEKPSAERVIAALKGKLRERRRRHRDRYNHY